MPRTSQKMTEKMLEKLELLNHDLNKLQAKDIIRNNDFKEKWLHNKFSIIKDRNVIKITHPDHKDWWLEIFRDNITETWGRSIGYAMRIDCNDYRYQNNRLKKDLGGKKLAESLYKKIMESFEKREKDNVIEEKRKMKDQTLSLKIGNALPNAVAIRKAMHGKMTFDYDSLKLSTYNGEDFNIEGLAYNYKNHLSAEAIKEINIVIKKYQKSS